MPYPLGVHEALQAWQDGAITYRRCLRLLGVDTIADLYAACRSSGVRIRTEPSEEETRLADRAIELIDREIARLDNPRCGTASGASEQNRGRLMRTIEISDATYETATRIAALDDIDVRTLIEDLVLRHAEYIDMLQKASSEKRTFGLGQRERIDRVDGPKDLPENEHLTVDQFFEVVSNSEERYELVGGVVHHVARANQRRNVIRSNVLTALAPAGKRRGCRVTSVNTGVRTGLDTIRYPDVVVDRGPSDAAAMTASEPAIIVEVCSPGDAVVDFGEKLREYQDVESVETIMRIDSEIALVQVHRRQQDGTWVEQTVEHLDAAIPLRSLATSVSLSEIYDTIDV